MEKSKYTRIQNRDSISDPPQSTQTLRRKVSRALSTLAGRERARIPSPTRTPSSASTSMCADVDTDCSEKTSPTTAVADKTTKEPTPKGSWSNKFALSRARSEPSLRAKKKQQQKSSAATPPPVPPVPAPTTTTYSRDVDEYVRAPTVQSSNSIVSYMYPLWRLDPVLVGCFVVL